MTTSSLTSNLGDDIRTYLDGQHAKEVSVQEYAERLRQEKLAFVQSVVGFFNTPGLQELLEKTGKKVVLHTSYSSSMGAIMTNSGPDYEVSVSKEGITEIVSGAIPHYAPFPADVGTWSKAIPYGGLFHDSSFAGDSEFRPDTASYIAALELQVRNLMK